MLASLLVLLPWLLLVLLLAPLLWYLLGVLATSLDSWEERDRHQEVQRGIGCAPLPPRQPPPELPPASAPPQSAAPASPQPLEELLDALPGAVAALARQVSQELERLAAAAPAPLPPQQEHELQELRRCVRQVCAGLRAIPEDLRGLPGGPGATTPTDDALAALARLQEGTRRLRGEVFAAAAERLRVLRRYAEGKYDRSGLDLD